ncbi:MAG: DUF2142 domain-containing protein [Chloroflexi bacterium]|nr:DUF2142 domain-containing protein [Chloroflexota bacterium]
MFKTIRLNPIQSMRLLVALFVGLSAQFVFLTPIFEAPDEPYHFTFAHQISNRWRLPNQKTTEGPAKQEASQPPLFYGVAAVLITPFSREGLQALREPNPHANTGAPDALINRNYVVQHEPYPIRFDPPRAAIYAVRLLNVVWGAVTVWAVWKTARAAAPDVPGIALLACGLTALNPQFAFISGAVNNDAMTAMWGSLILWQTLVMLREGFTTRRSVLIAILVALATLTKVSGLLFGITVAAAAIWRHFRERDWRGFLILALSGVVFWALIAGWWYARNLQLYGDFTGTSTMLRWVGQRPPVGFGSLLKELGSLTISYWSIFGWFNVLAPRLVYTVIDVLVIASAAGIGIGLWRLRRDRSQLVPWLVLALTFIMGLTALTAWTITTYGTQGRLLFPYIAAISALIAFGLTTLRVPGRMILAVLGVYAYSVPLTLIVPLYDPHEVLDTLPGGSIPFAASWDGQIEVVGHDVLEGTFQQGDLVPVTLYWTPIRTSETDYSLFLHLLTPDATIVGQVDSYPSGGLRRTSLWYAGQVYPDTYQIRITEPLPPGTLLRLEMGWYDARTGERLPAYDGMGEPAPSVIIPAGRAAP